MKNGLRDVYIVQRGGKKVILIVKRKIIFETVQKQITEKFVPLNARGPHIRYTFKYDKFLYT